MPRKTMNGRVARQTAINLSAQTPNDECNHPEICDGTRRGCVRGGECFNPDKSTKYRASIWHVIGPAILIGLIVFAVWGAFA